MHVVSCSVDVAAAVCSGSANAGPAGNVRPITLRKAKSMTKSTEKSLAFFGAPLPQFSDVPTSLSPFGLAPC